tara:strand:- start:28147 stop:28584 length:438 start_codon:yes stop_codon:yes gene_type:complete
MKFIAIIISTFFYLGKVRFAPGTVASLATLIIWNFITLDSLLIRLLIVLIITFLGFVSIKISSSEFKVEDPPEIVIDEVVGMSIPLLFIIDNFFLSVISFILFRILDICKPSIIYYSQTFKGEYGVLMDDILSGLIVALIIIHYL